VFTPLTARLPPVSMMLLVAFTEPSAKLRVFVLSVTPFLRVRVAATLLDRFNVALLPRKTEPLIVLSPNRRA